MDIMSAPMCFRCDGSPAVDCAPVSGLAHRIQLMIYRGTPHVNSRYAIRPAREM